MSNAELIAELKRRANFPEDVPDRAFLVGIRYLLNSAADALEEREEREPQKCYAPCPHGGMCTLTGGHTGWHNASGMCAWPDA